jgi:predicted ATPase
LVIERAVCPTLIGRSRELGLLEDALLDAGLGNGHVVVLAGHAGLGKTRLASELRREADKLGCTVLYGSCSEAELEVPFLPFLEAIGNHLGSADLDRLRVVLGPAAGDLARLFPQLGSGFNGDGNEDPMQSKLRFLEAVVGLLGALAEQRPLLLVVEDLHWADPSTHELIDYVARRVRAVPMLLLVTYRLEELDRQHRLHPTLQGWHRARLADTIELSALSSDDVGAMVCSILDEPDISREFRDYLHRRCDGNPFLLEEMLKEAIDRGDLFRVQSGWDRKAIGVLQIPKTVRDTILTRFERLDADAVSALRSAAVIGSSFDFPTLVAVSGFDELHLEQVVRTALRQQLIDEDHAQPGAFRFRHSLTWEVVYGDLPTPERRRLHGRVADVLARKGASKGECARHLAGADRIAEAVPRWCAAAEEAARKHAYADAAQLYERALPHMTDEMLRARTLGIWVMRCGARDRPTFPGLSLISRSALRLCRMRELSTRLRGTSSSSDVATPNTVMRT